MEKLPLSRVFANNLRHFRKKKKYSQQMLSLAIDKNQNYIGLIETCKSSPTFEAIEKIAQTLEIGEDALFCRSSCPENALAGVDIEKLKNQIFNVAFREVKKEINKKVNLAIKDAIGGV